MIGLSDETLLKRGYLRSVLSQAAMTGPRLEGFLGSAVPKGSAPVAATTPSSDKPVTAQLIKRRILSFGFEIISWHERKVPQKSGEQGLLR